MFLYWKNKYARSTEDDSVVEVVAPIPEIPPNLPENQELIAKVASSIASISIEKSEDTDPQLMKQSCHDSGIDIRDPNLPVVLHTKKNYSDADIVLSSDWVPPITIAPTDYTDTLSRTSYDTRLTAGGTSLTEPTVVGRKKTSSVSFSVDDNSDSSQHPHSTSSDKTSDNKKNKMLKRLSYPLTGLIEGLTGDDKPRNDSAESAPNTGDSNQSVFSKVFSR